MSYTVVCEENRETEKKQAGALTSGRTGATLVFLFMLILSRAISSERLLGGGEVRHI
jgi:hypothetical protein